MELDPTAIAAGVRLLSLDTVDSTNAEALRQARAGLGGPLWVAAKAQTAGRGRRGRPWVSAAGNLYATLLLIDPAPLRHAAQVSFVAALALHDAVAEVAPALGTRLALKWPNDLLCEGAKIAGILIEGEGADPLMMAVGIGVNCASHPPGTEYPATDLAALGSPGAPDVLFRTLSGRMAARLSQWERGAGFAAIRADWLARAFGRGAMIRVRLPDRETTGMFETLDEAGRLVLKSIDGREERITAGEVFPFAAAPDQVQQQTA
jgi:BirA family biotin operon repressor/biotin-[acetyl-CoA-carboxylase] ligase